MIHSYKHNKWTAAEEIITLALLRNNTFLLSYLSSFAENEFFY